MNAFFILGILTIGKAAISEDPEHKLPTICHVCKHTVTEFLEELDNSAKSKDVLQLGHIFQSENQRKIIYSTSDLRLIEALENTCQKINDYKVHKDKPSHLRYAKEESSTFTTLKALKGRGVKVDLGYPDEMWDMPDAEVYRLKMQCEHIIEKHEEDFNNWYYNHQDRNLYDWFCKDNVLKGKDQECFKGMDSPDEIKPTDEKETNKDHYLKNIKERNDENKQKDKMGDENIGENKNKDKKKQKDNNVNYKKEKASEIKPQNKIQHSEL